MHAASPSRFVLTILLLVLLAPATARAQVGPVRVGVSATATTVQSGSTLNMSATVVFFSNPGGPGLAGSVRWSVQPLTGSAVIDPVTGVLTGGTVGTVQVTGANGPFRGSMVITVTPAGATLNSIAVTPANPSVHRGLYQQFTATGTFSDASQQDLTSAVTWSSTLPNIASVNSAGLARANNLGQATIQASLNPVNGSTTMTVTPPVQVGLAVSPQDLTLPLGPTQQYTATELLSDNTTQDVTGSATWSSTSTGVATITATGLATTQAPGQTTIKAQFGAFTATSQLTVTLSVLNGQYAFALDGVDADGEFLEGGVFTADGLGNLTGFVDYNLFSALIQQPLTGTYRVGADGRATATITTASARGTDNLVFALSNSGNGYIVELDSDSIAWGTLEKQDPSAFPLSALNGPYALQMHGVGSSGPFSLVGQFTLSNGAVAGMVDTNSAGTFTAGNAAQGTLAASSAGRGTGTLTVGQTALHITYYVVSANRTLVVGVDFSPALVGFIERQTGPFGTSTLAGDFVFSEDGFSSMGEFTLAGRLHSNGGGVVTSGVEDFNDSGALHENLAISGTYALGADSHGSAAVTSTLGTSNFSVYAVSSSRALFISSDNNAVSVGTLDLQAPATYSNASLTGNLGFFAFGSVFPSNAAIAASGQLRADGSGNLAGTLDQNLFNPQAPVPPQPNVTLTGNYAVETTGRGTATITAGGTPAHLHFYFVDGNRLHIVQVDTNTARVGAAAKQF